MGWHISDDSAARWPVYISFPATIRSLALLATKRGTLGKRLPFIGNLSYSSYLLHFPLQLVIATVVTAMAIDPQIFYSLWVMVAFYIALIAISLGRYRYFEMPMQRWMRNRVAPRTQPPGRDAYQ